MGEPDTVFDLVRWILTTLLSLLWLWIALANGHAAWLLYVRRQPGPSIAPFLGGVVAWLAYLLCPLDSRQTLVPLLAALVLDAGTLLALPMVAGALWQDRAELAEDLLPRADRPRAIRLAGGLLGWFGLTVGLATLRRWWHVDFGTFLSMFILLTLAYWALCAVWIVRRGRRER